MDREIALPLRTADARTFSGSAFTGLIGAAEHEIPVKLYYVRFESGARTNWHSHSGEQILVIVAGRCRFQCAGEPVREAGAGESVRFDAGVRHWHGATETEPAEHVAINLTCHETNWLEPVSEADFRGTAPID